MRDPLADAMQALQQGMTGHARRYCKQVLKRDPKHPEANYLLGNIALQAGKNSEAAKLLKKAVAANAQASHYHIALGMALEALGQADPAIASFRKGVAIEPDNADMHNNLGNVLRSHGYLEEAVEEYRLALSLNADFSGALNNLGSTLHDLEAYEEAATHLQRAIALSPGMALPHNNLAMVYERMHRSEDAISHYRSAIQLDPANGLQHTNLAKLLLELGRFDESRQHVHQVLDLAPTEAYTIELLASYAGDIPVSEDEEQILHDVLKRPGDWSERTRALVLLSLGKILDKRGEYQQAFDHFAQFNSLRAKFAPFDPADHDKLIEQLIQVFDRNYFQQPPATGSNSGQPIFIVGMPRSGTSLVEQILASHPRIAGAGELSDFDDVTGGLAARVGSASPYPECAPSLDDETLGAICDAYLTHQAQFRETDEDRVTDKMPGNFLHLGLIASCFPEAHIIHCRRHPLDTCLSCFIQDFSDHHAYRHKLDQLGHYYRQYERLMAHWQDVVPNPIMDVSYEQLIGDLETASRHLLDFLGLEWDDACLQFHRHERKVRTASMWQVRQPAYSSSMGRWRPYEEQLAPLIEALGDVLPYEATK